MYTLEGVNLHSWRLKLFWGCPVEKGGTSQKGVLCPRDPPLLKILRRVNFGAGRKFGTEVAKRYGEGSGMLVFLGKRGRQKRCTESEKLYGSSKILARDSSAVLFLSTEESFGWVSTAGGR